VVIVHRAFSYIGNVLFLVAGWYLTVWQPRQQCRGFYCLQLEISYFSLYLSALTWNFINYYCKNAHTMFLSELLEEIPFCREACLAGCKFCSTSESSFWELKQVHVIFPRELLQYGDIPVTKIRGLGSHNPSRLFCSQMPHLWLSWTIWQ